MTRRLQRGDRLVVASHNPGKVWEINQLIAPYGLDAVSAGALGLAVPEEPEPTFEGNAKIKALFAAKGSGLPALADDSGIEIDALDGAPGVHTADWAGPKRDFTIAMQRVHEEMSARRAGTASPPRATSSPCCAWPGPTAKRSFSRARFTVMSSGRRAETTVSAMIRSSSPMATRSPSARWSPKEVCDLSPHPLFRALQARLPRAGGRLTSVGFGVYVHWPFCAQKCPYCDFNSHVRFGGIDEAAFPRAYLRELEHIARHSPGRERLPASSSAAARPR